MIKRVKPMWLVYWRRFEEPGGVWDFPCQTEVFDTLKRARMFAETKFKSIKESPVPWVGVAKIYASYQKGGLAISDDVRYSAKEREE